MQTQKFYSPLAYRIKQIKKRNGSFRTIYCPGRTYKRKLVNLHREIKKLDIYKELVESDHCHGFLERKSCVTNALKHRGFVYTLSFDLKDFFDTVTKRHLSNVYFNINFLHNYNLAFINDHLCQGFPTSPSLANIAAYPMDKVILTLCANLNVVYTRYADDLTFSCNDLEKINILKERIPQIVSDFNFVINKNKTHLQFSKIGRREVTGIMVDNKIHPRRQTKRLLRVALHKQRTNQAQGLKEWMSLKSPNQYGINLTPIRKIEKKEDIAVLMG